MPLFSIVIPVYNSEVFLERCLLSISNQSLTDFEAIIVDDGSSDSSGEICDTFSSTRSNFKVIHQKNKGVVFARQAGVDNSSGRYLVFVDSDDYIDEDFLLEFSRVINAYSPDVICSNYFEVNGEQMTLIKTKYEYGFYDRDSIVKRIFPSLILSKEGNGFPPQLWGKAFDASLYKKNQLINRKVVMGEDGACTRPTIANANSLFLLDRTLYYYRRNQYSITKSKAIIPWEGPEIRGEHLFNKMALSDFDFTEQIFRDVSLALFTVARSRFNQKNMDLASIKQDIRTNLKNPFYSKAISKASFTKLKLRLIIFSLKHRWFLFMRLYNRFRG